MTFQLGMNGFSLDNKANDYDVIIIGGGPAGTTAAIYAARSELRTLVIDKGLTAGALGVTSKISNYPGVPGPISGAKLVEIMRQQAELFGATFITDKVVGIVADGEHKEIIAGTGNYRTKVVILATGAMGRTSTVKGEEALLGRGVSYCATCDGAFFRDQDVAVIGNNDEALEEALFLTKYAQSIHLIVPTPELKARGVLAHEVAENPKIKIRLATRLKEIVGNGRVDSIIIHPRQGEPETVPVTGAFVYLQGSQPITDYLMGQLATTPEGCLVVDSDMQTSMPGVFAVGDLLCTHIKQAVVAASDGVLAAVAADKYVNGRKKAAVDWG